MIEVEELSMPRVKSSRPLPHLRDWRINRALTQKELAAKANVGEATVARAELGKEVSALNAAKLAKALDITLKQLQEQTPE